MLAIRTRSLDIATPPADGRVIGVFSGGVAWLDIDESLHMVTGPVAGNSVATVVADLAPGFDFHRTAIAPGDEVVREGVSLRIGGGALVVDLADADPWRPPEPGSLQLEDVDTDRPDIRERETEADLFRHPAVVELASALADRDGHRFFTAARGLIGRGTGLTPAGDDLLTGIMAAGIMSEGTDSWIGSVAKRLSKHARGRTTVYSHAMLRHVARGRPFARLTDFLFALTSRDDRAIENAMSLLHQRGATSGRVAGYGAVLGTRNLAKIKGSMLDFRGARQKNTAPLNLQCHNRNVGIKLTNQMRAKSGTT